MYKCDIEAMTHDHNVENITSKCKGVASCFLAQMMTLENMPKQEIINNKRRHISSLLFMSYFYIQLDIMLQHNFHMFSGISGGLDGESFFKLLAFKCF